MIQIIKKGRIFCGKYREEIHDCFMWFHIISSDVVNMLLYSSYKHFHI